MKRLVWSLMALTLPYLALADEPLTQSGYPCNTKSAAQTITLVRGTLLVCYFGSTPRQKNDGWIYVAGVSFYRLLPKVPGDEFIAEADELGLGIDYRLSDSKLEIVHFMDTYPEFETTPFYKETINFGEVPAQHEKQLIYRPSRVSREEVNKAISFLRIDETRYRQLYYRKHGPGLIYEQLFKLREYAFFASNEVAPALKDMERYWWSTSGGEIEEIFHTIQREVSIISSIQGAQQQSSKMISS